MGKSKEGRILAESIICGIGAYVVGDVFRRHYDALDHEGKSQWDEARIVHHGELGCLALAAGVLGKSPQLAGVGLGLMASDAQDFPKWFKPVH